jgi:hypothetical protein
VADINDVAAEIARWRQKFKAVDGVLVWRADPAENRAWNSRWTGKLVVGPRVFIDGRRLSSAMILRALTTGEVDERLRRAGRPVDMDGICPTMSKSVPVRYAGRSTKRALKAGFP